MTPEEIIDLVCAVAFRGGHCADAHAIIAALHAAGYKIMAREPTEAMNAEADRRDPMECASPDFIFRAMWDAAP